MCEPCLCLDWNYLAVVVAVDVEKETQASLYQFWSRPMAAPRLNVGNPADGDEDEDDDCC